MKQAWKLFAHKSMIMWLVPCVAHIVIPLGLKKQIIINT